MILLLFFTFCTIVHIRVGDNLRIVQVQVIKNNGAGNLRIVQVQIIKNNGAGLFTDHAAVYITIIFPLVTFPARL